ncbi:MAG: hypothetical protein R3F58_03410 [Steroidobacteraceae bacterium]
MTDGTCSTRGALLLCAAVLALTACSDASNETAAAAAETAQIAAARRNAAAETEDMVSAVAAGKPGAPIDVRFDVPTKPRVGEPLKIDVAVVPLSTVGRLEVLFQGNDGFAVVSNGQLGPLDNPAVGKVLRHSVTVLPQSEGVFMLSAIAMTDGTDASMSRSFAMPIIVGNASAVASKPQNAVTDATGETVQSLPAVETPR